MKARVVRVNRTTYLSIPVDEARRLGLVEGQVVDVEVQPVTGTVGDAMKLFGKYKGFVVDDDMWRDP